MAQIFGRDPYNYGDNLLSHTDALASWTKIDSGDVLASTTTATMDPIGSKKAGTIAGDATAGQHGASLAWTPPIARFEVSLLLKAGSKTVFYVATGITNCTSYIDLSTGLPGTIGAAATVTTENVGGGWYGLKIRGTGAGAAVTMQISPVDADASTTMTGGDGATVNGYVYKPRARAVYVDDDDTRTVTAIRGTDRGELIIAGADADTTHRATVSPANKARTLRDNVLLVQNLTSSGSTTTPVDIFAQSLTAVKVSKDVNANATANRIFVSNNLDQLAGSAIAVGEGALAATGLQRITIHPCNRYPVQGPPYDGY
jgi:hypothetical protein